MGDGLTSNQGSDPQISLSLSRDNGRTWGAEMWKPFGKTGEYSTRVEWRRLGSPRQITPKLRITDPVPVCIVRLDQPGKLTWPSFQTAEQRIGDAGRHGVARMVAVFLCRVPPAHRHDAERHHGAASDHVPVGRALLLRHDARQTHLVQGAGLDRRHRRGSIIQRMMFGITTIDAAGVCGWIDVLDPRRHVRRMPQATRQRQQQEAIQGALVQARNAEEGKAALAPYQTTGTLANRRLRAIGPWRGAGSGQGYQDILDAKMAQYRQNSAPRRTTPPLEVAGGALANLPRCTGGIRRAGRQQCRRLGIADAQLFRCRPQRRSGVSVGPAIRAGSGTKAINERAIANGGYDPGRRQGADAFGNDYGSTKANESFTRNMTQRQNTYNMLSGASGAGQNAAVGAAGWHAGRRRPATC